jgi:NADPH:quinone reductase-like Zn-dependent oxidoreductase
LQTGQRVLIHGAAGGVGSFAVQFARWKGGQVIGTTSPTNRDFVQALGADTVIDYTSTPFEEVVHDVDLVLDTIGGETLRRSMQTVRPGGMVVSLVEQPPTDLAQKYRIQASRNAAPPTNDLLSAIVQLIAEGHVKPIVARTFGLAEAGQAQEMSQSGHGRGRIVLHINE